MSYTVVGTSAYVNKGDIVAEKELPRMMAERLGSQSGAGRFNIVDEASMKMNKQCIFALYFINSSAQKKIREPPAMPMSDALIDEYYGEEILAIHMDRGGNSEEHVTYFLGAGRIWLYRAEIITRMMRGKKFYVSKGGWRGELEIVQNESTKGSYLRTIPDPASPYSLLSLPRG